MIIYYSGTGNSFTIAHSVANKLNDKAIHINDAAKLKTINDEVVGFVVPVHNYDIPRFVARLIEKMEFANVKYTFGIITHGGDKGNSILSFQTLLNDKGVKLNYYNDILMPVNSRIMYGMLTDKIEERTSLANQKIDTVVEDIVAGKQSKLIGKKHFIQLMHNLVESDWTRNKFTPEVKSDLCVNCGICSKVCPVGNITEVAGKAFINNKCEQCTACMHWCPSVAIHYKKRNIKEEQQYHHPDVKVQDFFL